jgi:GntR family transcriptional regulator
MNESRDTVIEFHLDTRSGVSPYLQVIHQVRHALRLGLLAEGDQLPTVKDVVARLAINPNTVLKAYRELEYEGLVAARAGVGTFVTRTLADESLAAHAPLRADLERWLASARKSGLDDESIEALFATTFRNSNSANGGRPAAATAGGATASAGPQGPSKERGK